MTDIVPRPPTRGRLVPQPGGSLLSTPCSWDVATREGRARLLACTNPGDVQFDGQGRAQILAVDWAIFADQGEDPETGELSEYARTVLVDAQGRTFRTTSAHAPHFMARCLDLYTAEEWAQGIPFVIRERRSRKTGRTYHDIRVDWSAGVGDG